MKKTYGKVFVILAFLIIGAVVLSAFHLAGQGEPSDQTVTILADGGEQAVNLEAVSLSDFEGEMRRKVGEPTPHTFRGIALEALLFHAGVNLDRIDGVRITSEDNYQVTLTRDEISADHNIYLVTEMDGEELLSIDGDKRLPMIVVLRDEFATRWVKYAVLIEVH